MKEIMMQIKVKREIYRGGKSDYRVLEVEIIDYPEGLEPPTANHIINGNYKSNAHIGDILSVQGEWRDSGRHGYQFNFNAITLDIPEKVDGLKKFLTKHIRGVGMTTANRLVDALGLGLIDIALDTPEKIYEVEGVSKKVAQEVINDISTLTAFRRTSRKFHWLRWADISKIIEKVGNFADDTMSNNPYLARDIIGFERCDYSAKMLGFKNNSSVRVSGAIHEVLKQELNRGHLYTDKGKLYKEVHFLLNRYKHFETIGLANDEFKDVKDELIVNKRIIKENNRIYTKFYNDIENKIVDEVKKRSGTSFDGNKREKIKGIIKKRKINGLSLGLKQEEAVIMALENDLSILTGNPGTGKTYTLGVIIDTIKELDPYTTITLAAPTGKAAKRMMELTSIKSSTIHRLLGIHEEDTKDFVDVDSDYLIIDESSMIDAYLFYAVLSSVSVDTKVILTGDPQQLPSVGPGLILRDLIDSKVVSTTHLTEVHRQAEGSQIIANANNIINEKQELHEDRSKGDFFFLDYTNETEIREIILFSIERLLKTGFKIEDIQVLTPQNKGELGVINLNKLIQEKFNKRKDNEKIRIGNSRTVHLRDKVIHTENNKDLDVYNGETGTVVAIKNGREQEVVVDFGDKKVTYTRESFSELQLAYALSVHKSQGSEYRAVIMPIHNSHSNLTKDMLYTGITRASERVVLIGEKGQYFKAIKNKENLVRRSMIKEKLMNVEEMSA